MIERGPTYLLRAALALPAVVALALWAQLWTASGVKAGGNSWYISSDNAPTPTPVNVAYDWTTAALSCWTFENAATSQGSCGSTCNLVTAFGGSAPSYSTTTGKVFGTHAVHVDDGAAFVCTGNGANGCPNWSPGANSNFSVSLAVYHAEDDAGILIDGHEGGAGGFEISRGNSQDRYLFDWWSTGKTAQSGVSTASINTQRFVVTTVAGNNGAANTYFNGSSSADGNSTNGFWIAQASTDNIFFGADQAGANDADAYLDDVCTWDLVLGPQTRCRLCSCGVKGDVDNGGLCECDAGGTTYANEGRNDASCGDCALPACNATGPTTS